MTLHTEDTEIASQLLSSLKKPAGEIKPESKVGPEKPEIVKSNTPKKPTKPDIEEISRKTEKLNLNIPKEPVRIIDKLLFVEIKGNLLNSIDFFADSCHARVENK